MSQTASQNKTTVLHTDGHPPRRSPGPDGYHTFALQTHMVAPDGYHTLTRELRPGCCRMRLAVSRVRRSAVDISEAQTSSSVSTKRIELRCGVQLFSFSSNRRPAEDPVVRVKRLLQMRAFRRKIQSHFQVLDLKALPSFIDQGGAEYAGRQNPPPRHSSPEPVSRPAS